MAPSSEARGRSPLPSKGGAGSWDVHLGFGTRAQAFGPPERSNTVEQDVLILADESTAEYGQMRDRLLAMDRQQVLEKILKAVDASELEGIRSDFASASDKLAVDDFVGLMLRHMDLPHHFAEEDSVRLRRTEGVHTDVSRVPQGRRLQEPLPQEKNCTEGAAKEKKGREGKEKGGYKTAEQFSAPGSFQRTCDEEEDDRGNGEAPSRIHLDHRYDEMAALLVDAFDAIDTEGAGLITWEAFANALAQQGKFQSSEEASSDFERYEFIGSTELTSNRDYIERLVYIEELDRTFCLFHKARNFAMFDAMRGTVEQTISVPDGSIVDMCYLPGFKYLASAGSDKTIRFWTSATVPSHQYATCKAQPTCLTSFSPANALLSGSAEGSLNMWDVSKMKLKESRVAHRDAVNAILPLPYDDTVFATASSDTCILLWDSNRMVPTRSLKGHRKTVLSLSYSKDYSCLLSAGLDKDAFVWSPCNLSSPICHLQGHPYALCGVAVIPGTAQVLTADASGTLRLWDLRNFRSIQTFGGRMKTYGELSTFCVVPPHKRILTGSTHVDIYEFTEGKKRATRFTDHDGCSDAVYTPIFNSVLTAGPHKIQTWSGRTGIAGRVLQEIEKAEITAICLDALWRRLYVGDSLGYVRTFDALSGNLINNNTKHPVDICLIHSWRGSYAFVSASCDGLLLLQEEYKATQSVHSDELLPATEEQDGRGSNSKRLESMTPSAQPVARASTGVRYRAQFGGDGISCLAAAPSLEMLACGSGWKLHLLCIRSLRKEATIKGFSAAVAAVDVLEAYGLLVVADQGGVIYLWQTTLRTAPFTEWTCIYCWENLPDFSSCLLPHQRESTMVLAPFAQHQQPKNEKQLSEQSFEERQEGRGQSAVLWQGQADAHEQQQQEKMDGSSYGQANAPGDPGSGRDDKNEALVVSERDTHDYCSSATAPEEAGSSGGCSPLTAEAAKRNTSTFSVLAAAGESINSSATVATSPSPSMKGREGLLPQKSEGRAASAGSAAPSGAVPAAQGRAEAAATERAAAAPAPAVIGAGARRSLTAARAAGTPRTPREIPFFTYKRKAKLPDGDETLIAPVGVTVVQFNHFQPASMQIYSADKKGILRCWNLEHVAAARRLFPLVRLPLRRHSSVKRSTTVASAAERESSSLFTGRKYSSSAAAGDVSTAQHDVYDSIEPLNSSSNKDPETKQLLRFCRASRVGLGAVTAQITKWREDLAAGAEDSSHRTSSSAGSSSRSADFNRTSRSTGLLSRSSNSPDCRSSTGDCEGCSSRASSSSALETRTRMTSSSRERETDAEGNAAVAAAVAAATSLPREEFEAKLRGFQRWTSSRRNPVDEELQANGGLPASRLSPSASPVSRSSSRAEQAATAGESEQLEAAHVLDHTFLTQRSPAATTAAASATTEVAPDAEASTCIGPHGETASLPNDSSSSSQNKCTSSSRSSRKSVGAGLVGRRDPKGFHTPPAEEDGKRQAWERPSGRKQDEPAEAPRWGEEFFAPIPEVVLQWEREAHTNAVLALHLYSSSVGDTEFDAAAGRSQQQGQQQGNPKQLQQRQRSLQKLPYRFQHQQKQQQHDQQQQTRLAQQLQRQQHQQRQFRTSKSNSNSPGRKRASAGHGRGGRRGGKGENGRAAETTAAPSAESRCTWNTQSGEGVPWLLTVGADRLVKTWSRDLQPLGKLSQDPSGYWVSIGDTKRRWLQRLQQARLLLGLISWQRKPQQQQAQSSGSISSTHKQSAICSNKSSSSTNERDCGSNSAGTVNSGYVISSSSCSATAVNSHDSSRSADEAARCSSGKSQSSSGGTVPAIENDAAPAAQKEFFGAADGPQQRAAGGVSPGGINCSQAWKKAVSRHNHRFQPKRTKPLTEEELKASSELEKCLEELQRDNSISPQ